MSNEELENIRERCPRLYTGALAWRCSGRLYAARAGMKRLTKAEATLAALDGCERAHEWSAVPPPAAGQGEGLSR